jgi:hypothetical protein
LNIIRYSSAFSEIKDSLGRYHEHALVITFVLTLYRNCTFHILDFAIFINVGTVVLVFIFHDQCVCRMVGLRGGGRRGLNLRCSHSCNDRDNIAGNNYDKYLVKPYSHFINGITVCICGNQLFIKYLKLTT